jgi:hypothetical protein
MSGKPLLSIADLAGGGLAMTARQAAVALAGGVEDQDITVELLRDVSEILIDITDSIISTKDLLAKLIEREDRPWRPGGRTTRPMTARGLARLLGPLNIHPDRHRRVARGYRCDAFSDAIDRYLPSQVSTVSQPQ